MRFSFSAARIFLATLCLGMLTSLTAGTAFAAADLSVSKSCASNGAQSVLCTVIVTNIGNVNSLAPLSISDVITGTANANLTGAGGTLPASCTPGAQLINNIAVTCPNVNTSLAPSASGTFLTSYSMPSGGSFTNCVSVSAAQNASTPGDPNAANNNNICTSFVVAPPTSPTPKESGSVPPLSEMPLDQVFDWAESRYPELFPSEEKTATLDAFKYRYYPATDLYVGISAGEVYLSGKTQTGGQIVHVGSVSDIAEGVSSCDQAVKLDSRGFAVLPAEAFEIEALENVEEDIGSLSSLYPDMDTTTDEFYPNLLCNPSIGGTLPPEELPTQDVLDAADFVDSYENKNWGPDVIQTLVSNGFPDLGGFDAFTPGNCFFTSEATAAAPASRKQADCNNVGFLNSSAPFEGRDVIYVHGLDTKHMNDRIANPTGPASKLWPADLGEFLNAGGYFRTSAQSYWTPHLIEHLSAPAGSNSWPGAGWQWTTTDPVPVYAPKPNRYLVVAWNTNQSIEYAQHALLTQIYLAITANRNVVTPSTFPSGQVRPFCSNGCIVIGHSTGPLITSSAFGRAASGNFGTGGEQIARQMLIHVSMDGAISGSRIATAGLAVASAGAPIAGASNVLCPIVDELTGSTNSCNADLSFLFNSVLRDLVPAVAQGLWGHYIDLSPVPTVTIAGGHPRGNQAGGLTQWLLPGMDDGVVTMNSACGNPNPVFPGTPSLVPSGITVLQQVKAFEFSDWLPRLLRGTKLWTSQHNLMTVGLQPGYLAASCTPYLSSSGMVMPVASSWGGTQRDARKRYHNHYSFMQSLSEHSYDGGGSPIPSQWPSYTGGPASQLREYAPLNATGTAAVSGINVEESRVVTDANAYSMTLDTNGTHLIKQVDMRVIKRGQRISFHMPFNIGNCTKQGVLRYYCQRWIWQRTYHLADKWEKKQSSHYVYEFVGRR